MNKLTTSQRLKQYMNIKGWKQADILEAVKPYSKKYGVKLAKSSLSQYVSGAFEPSQDKLALLGMALNVSEAWLMGFDVPMERKEKEQPSDSEDCPVVSIYNSLNKQGRDEYIRYGRYLSSQDIYRADDAVPQLEYIRFYRTPAAAGYASPIEGEDYELVVKSAGIPHRADFCIRISGDSMEPYIHDGQTVYVERGVDVSDMDVGIFFVDGDVFCKQYCRDYSGTVHLLSANPKREDANVEIRKNSGRSLVCFGKVLLPHKLPAPVYDR